MATAKQLAALAKARAARKKKVKAKPSKRKKKPAKKKNRRSLTAKMFVMTLLKNNRRVGCFYKGNWDDSDANYYPTLDALKADIAKAKRKTPYGYGIGYDTVKK